MPLAWLTPQSCRIRERAMQVFSDWLRDHHQLELSDLDSASLAGWFLASFGQDLYVAGHPLYVYVHAILAFVDCFPHLKQNLAAAWSTYSRWQQMVPTERRTVFPAVVFKASVTVALLWGWARFAALLIIGFLGLLRPGELVNLQRRHLVLPADVLSDELNVCYIRLERTKTRRIMHRQHAQVSDGVAVRFLTASLLEVPANEFIFGGSQGQLRRRWNAVFGTVLGLPVSEKGGGITPASLRGSGATWLHRMTENIPRIAWRGRWTQTRTLEHYLQDVAGQYFLVDVSPEKRQLITELAAFFGDGFGLLWVALPPSHPSCGPRVEEVVLPFFGLILHLLALAWQGLHLRVAGIGLARAALDERVAGIGLARALHAAGMHWLGQGLDGTAFARAWIDAAALV
eukprot:1326684-Amphidinium_carterae.1